MPVHPDIFDYVIVGGGSAGGWIARRLAARDLGSVALIEAGPRAGNVRTVVPNWYPRTFGTKLDWNLITEPQAGLSGRRMPWPRGRLLGGSGAINAMIYLQAAASDFMRWGWDWAPSLVESSLLDHAQPASPHPWARAFVAAAAESGLQRVAPWTQSIPNSCGLFSIAARHGRRVHTGQALDGFSDLQILTDCQAERIELHQQRAVAVHLKRATGQTERIAARRAIVLCAGVIGTPQLLWQSGIGPAAQLGELSIDCQLDLPAVGKNLQDHLVFPVVFETSDAHGLSRRSSLKDRQRYRLAGEGLLSSNIAEAGAVLSISDVQPGALPDSTTHDVQIHFTATHYLRYPRLTSTNNHMSLAVTDLHPSSRGSITFQWSHGVDQRTSGLVPVIDPQYLMDANDLSRMYQAVEAARAIARQPDLRGLIQAEVLPGARRQDCRSMERSIRSLSQSMYHPIGTCRVQTSDSCELEATVVDREFQVHGISGLRIADASVIPDLPSGNTNATTLLIAARLCQLLQSAAAR